MNGRLMKMEWSGYAQIIYVREDNRFYARPPLRRVFEHIQTREHAVVTDTHCEHGTVYSALNDKIFITNQLGAELLYGNISALFRAWFRWGYNRQIKYCIDLSGFALSVMGRWEIAQDENQVLRQVDANSSWPDIRVRFDMMQSEAFLSEYLKANNALHFREDLQRIDARYVNGELCVAAAYEKCSRVPAGGLPLCAGQSCFHSYCDPYSTKFQKELATLCFKLMSCTSELRNQKWSKQVFKSSAMRKITDPCHALQIASARQSSHLQHTEALILTSGG